MKKSKEIREKIRESLSGQYRSIGTMPMEGKSTVITRKRRVKTQHSMRLKPIF